MTEPRPIEPSDDATQTDAGGDGSGPADGEGTGAETGGETPASDAPNAWSGRLDERTENLIDTYEITAEWIRFADAKAAVVLTVNGALASVLVPTLGAAIEGAGGGVGRVAIALFGLWGALTLLSCVQAFLCILPFRQRGRHPALERCAHFHGVAIAERYGIDQVEEFETDYHALGDAGFQRQILSGLLIDAHISSAKYARITNSIRALALAAVFGFAYLVLIQI